MAAAQKTSGKVEPFHWFFSFYQVSSVSSAEAIRFRAWSQMALKVWSLMSCSILQASSSAEEDACKMEHDISDQTFKAICDHARKRMASADETEET